MAEASHEKMKAHQGRMVAKMDSNLKVMPRSDGGPSRRRLIKKRQRPRQSSITGLHA
jgi:hypothetical protein